MIITATTLVIAMALASVRATRCSQKSIPLAHKLAMVRRPRVPPMGIQPPVTVIIRVIGPLTKAAAATWMKQAVTISRAARGIPARIAMFTTAIKWAARGKAGAAGTAPGKTAVIIRRRAMSPAWGKWAVAGITTAAALTAMRSTATLPRLVRGPIKIAAILTTINRAA